MAIYYAIKSPSGTFSDFTTNEKTSINRFLRRQSNWDSLWVNWLSCGYTTEKVRLVKEEASRLNKKLDYYRDSSKVIKLRHESSVEVETPVEDLKDDVEDSAEAVEEFSSEDDASVSDDASVAEEVIEQKASNITPTPEKIEKDIKKLSDEEYNDILSPAKKGVEVPPSLSRETKPVDVKKFVNRSRSSNASAIIPDKPVSVPVPKAPKRKQQPKSDLVWPAIIGISDDGLSAESKIKKNPNVSKLPTPQYEPQALGTSSDMQFDKVAFSEGGDELSAPRVVKKKAIEEDPIIGRDSIGMKSGGLNLKPLISTPKKDK